MNYYGYEVIREEEIRHHGILGQKWGQRNGPPYPLGASDHSASERKAGWRKSLEEKENNENSNVKKNKTKKSQNNIRKSREISSKTGATPVDYVKKLVQTKQFKTAMKVAIGVAATYAAYKIGEKYVDNLGINIMMDAFDIEQDPGFKNIAEMPKYAKSIAEEYFASTDTTAYRPLIDNINHGANLSEDFGRNMNCTMCTAAIIGRLKGYEVTATTTAAHGYPPEVLEKYVYDGAKYLSPKSKSISSLEEYLLEQGDGHYGDLHVTFKHSKSGHSIAYTIKQGKVELLDGQSQKRLDFYEFLSNMDIKKTKVADLTTCGLKEDYVRCVMP